MFLSLFMNIRNIHGLNYLLVILRQEHPENSNAPNQTQSKTKRNEMKLKWFIRAVSNHHHTIYWLDGLIDFFTFFYVHFTSFPFHFSPYDPNLHSFIHSFIRIYGRYTGFVHIRERTTQTSIRRALVQSVDKCCVGRCWSLTQQLPRYSVPSGGI